MQPITALVVGLHNRHKHQIVRQVEKYGIKVEHIDGDRRSIDKYPVCDIAICTICGCSHGAVEDVLSVYRKHGKPYLTTHDSFSPIRERFEAFINEQRAAQQKEIVMSSQVTKFKYFVYSNFKLNEEFTRRDLVRVIQDEGVNIDAVSQNIRNRPNPILVFKDSEGPNSGIRFILKKKGGEYGRTYVFQCRNESDIVEFKKEKMDLTKIRALHGDFVKKALGEKPDAPAIIPVNMTPVVKSVPVQVPESDENMDPVLKDLRAAVGLLVEQLHAVEKIKEKAKVPPEDIELAKRAREWTTAIPFLNAATPDQLRKVSAMCQVLFS